MLSDFQYFVQGKDLGRQVQFDCVLSSLWCITVNALFGFKPKLIYQNRSPISDSGARSGPGYHQISPAESCYL